MTAGEQKLALTFPKAAAQATAMQNARRQVDAMVRSGDKTTAEIVERLTRALEQPAKPFSVHYRLRTAEQLEAQRSAIAKIVAAGHRPPDTLGQALARAAAENA